MKLSVIGICILLWGFSTASLAASANPQFNACLKKSLARPTPPERDEARQACLRKNLNMSLSTCVLEAQRMEYLQNEQTALVECYESKPRFWSRPNCFAVAKKLHTLTERDEMRIDCLNQMGLPRDKKACLHLAKAIEQSHHRNVIARACLEL